MKTIHALAALLAAVALVAPASAQMGTPVPPECKEMQAFVGKWAGKAKFSFMGSEAEGPVQMENTLVLDGRFLQSHHEYEMPGMGKFKGLMLLTFDGTKKQWASWWYDSSDSGNMAMAGGVKDGWYVMEGTTEMEGMKMEMRSSWMFQDNVWHMKLEMKQGDAWAPMMVAEYKKAS